MSWIHLIYIPLLGFGFFMNILLMIAIIRGTPKSFKTYSILIFYGSLNDLIVILGDALAFERLIVKLPSFTFVAFGPCRLISNDLCNYCNSIMTSGLVESILIQSISFGYRNHILSRPTPKARIIHAIVLLATVPNIVHLVLFKRVKTTEDSLFSSLSIVYPTTNWTGATFYGIPVLGESYPAALFGIFFVIIPVLFGYLIITRTRLLKNLRNISQLGKMSERTLELHKLLVNILTIHALLPLSMIVALICIGLLVMENYSPDLEALAYLSAMIAPTVSPAVTIWLLTPYRKFVINSLLRVHTMIRKETITKIDITSIS